MLYAFVRVGQLVFRFVYPQGGYITIGACARKFVNLSPHLGFGYEEEAAKRFDDATGIGADELFLSLQRMQTTPTDAPRPLVCAKAYAYLLDNLQLEINERTPFSVKFNVGIDYSEFSTPSIFQRAFPAQTNKIRAQYLPTEYERFKVLASVGLDWMAVDFTHTIPNWPHLLDLGFPGILQNARESRERLSKSYRASR